jgi:hypothetical protein
VLARRPNKSEHAQLKLREKRQRRGLVATLEIIAQLRVADKKNRGNRMTKRKHPEKAFQ